MSNKIKYLRCADVGCSECPLTDEQCICEGTFRMMLALLFDSKFEAGKFPICYWEE